MAGDDDVGLEPFELGEDLDPPVPVGVSVGEDRERLSDAGVAAKWLDTPSVLGIRSDLSVLRFVLS